MAASYTSLMLDLFSAETEGGLRPPDSRGGCPYILRAKIQAPPEIPSHA